jgi:hypothetical protein
MRLFITVSALHVNGGQIIVESMSKFSERVKYVNGPSQKCPFCLSGSYVLKVPVSLCPDQRSHRNYVKSLTEESFV